MSSQVIASCLKWSQKKSQALTVTAVAGAVASALLVQSVSLFRTVATVPSGGELAQHVRAGQKVDVLSLSDFTLLFGEDNQPATPKPSAELPKTNLKLVLRGIAGQDDSNSAGSSAIIQSNNQDRLYSIGSVLPGGGTLHAVYSDHIVISRNGRLEVLNFPEISKDDRSLQEYRGSRDANPRAESGHNPMMELDPQSVEQQMNLFREMVQQATQEFEY